MDIPYKNEKSFQTGGRVTILKKVNGGLSLCVMLAMPLGRIKEKQPEKMKSLVS